MGSWVRSAGLVLDIIGVVLPYRYGLPQHVLRGGPTIVIAGTDPDEARKAETYDRIAHAALVLVVSGFALQIVGNHVG